MYTNAQWQLQERRKRFALEAAHMAKIKRLVECDLGVSSEANTIQLLFRHSSELAWIASFRKASDEEDRLRHIDIVIETKDIGLIFLQVKSSEKGAEKFKKGFPRWVGAVYVFDRHETEEVAWARLRSALVQTRQHILQIRGQPPEDADV